MNLSEKDEHDLRSAIGVIQGATDVLGATMALNGNRKFLDIVVRNAAKALEILDARVIATDLNTYERSPL